LPARGGTSARCSLDFVLLAFVSGFGAGADAFGVPAVATTVGFATAAPFVQLSFWSRTAAAAAAAFPVALSSSPDGIRKIAPRLSALMLSW